MKHLYLSLVILISAFIISTRSSAQFSGAYAPANWSFSNSPVNTGGSLNTSAAPTSITLTSGNSGISNGSTLYTITIPCSGTITFSWSYITFDIDGPAFDLTQYSINGGTPINLPGFNPLGANSQSGTASIAVNAGNTFSLIMFTTDGILGSATSTFSNWVGPVCIPCSGMPNATAISSATSVCPTSSSFTLSLTGLPVVTGLSYQWQSSPPCAGNFTNLPAPSTGSSYNVSNLAASTDYRAIITCATSGLSFTTNIISITALPTCYCTSSATGFQNTDIGQVVVGTYANPAAPPGSLTQPGATQTYTNYLNASPIILATGSTFPLNATQVNTTATYNVSHLKAYIDYNKNGNFTDPGEEIFSQTGPATSIYNGFSGNFTVPTTATPGYTRMRFVLWQGGNASTVIPCTPSPPTAYSFGETEDYRVLIQAAPTASSNSPICQGNTLNLNSNVTSACATYSWAGPGGFTSTAQNPIILNAGLAQAGVYTVSATAFGTTTSSSTTVIINPAVTATINVTICSGNSYTLGSQVLTTSGLYSQLFQTTQGCDSNVTLNLIVTPLPGPPTVISPVNICQGATTSTLTAIGTNLLWYNTSTGGLGSVTPPTPSSASLGTTTYYVSQTVNGCESSRDSIVVIVNPPPPTGTTSSTNPTTCNGSDGTITINGLTTNTTYIINYSKNGLGQTPVTLTSNAGGSLTLTGLTAGIYSPISVTVNSCTSTVAGALILNNPVAPATPIAGGNTPVCAGATLNLTASTIAAATYNWTGPNSFTSTMQNPVLVGVTTAASGNYFVAATLNGCTSAAGTVLITVNPIPAAPIASSNSPICAGGTLNLIASTIGGATYSWVGPGSFSSSSQNPSIAATTVAASGAYSVITTVNGCTSLAGSTSVIVNPIPIIGSTTLLNPSTCGGTNGSISLNGLVNNTSYIVSYSKNGVPQTAVTLLSNATGALTVAGLSAGLYSNIVITLNGCNSLPAGPVTLTDPTAPGAPLSGNNGPLCVGSTLNLTVSTVAGGTYTWTGPGGFNSSAQNPNIPNVQTANGGVYSITVTVNACISSASTTTVVVNTIPSISSVTFIDPTTCNGTNGSITLSGLNSSATYTVSFTKNGISQPSIVFLSGSGGTITINGLAAGTYSNIVATLNGCSSVPGGPVTLTDPLPPAAPIAGNNGPVCQGASINLFASTVAGSSYSWTGPTFSSSNQNPTIINSQTTNSGVYSVTATANGCTSVAATTAVVVNPLPVISSTSFTNPITCGGTNGSISLVGLQPITSYSVNYVKNGTPFGPVVISSSGAGTIIINGLSAGTYSNINVTFSNCASTNAGPITLLDPSPPAAPVAGSNSPVCEGAALNLTSSTLAGATYSWAGPVGFNSSSQNPTIATTLTSNGGTYSVTATINNCTSLPGTVTIVVIPTPVISSGAFINPTGCNGTNGSITLVGLNNTTTYTVNYSKNNVAQTPVLILSSGTGTITIPNLAAGNYTNIQVTFNGCLSNIIGPLVLSDPANPTSPTVSNNGPLCTGATLNLTASSVTGATYSWTGPAFSSTSQNPFIPSVALANAGVYSVTVTLNNCISTPATTIVVVNSTPAIAAGSNSPVCEGSNLSLTSTSFGGATYSWTGPGFTSNNQNPTITNVTTSSAGIYSVTASLNGCNSTSNVTVSIIPTPAAPAVSNGSYCQSTIASPLTATGQNLLWYMTPIGGAGSTIAPTPSTANAGTFTWYVSQTVSGCEGLRTPITVTIIAKPQPPVVTPTITYCQSMVATALSANGQNIKWYTTLSGGTGSTIAPTPSTNIAGNTAWYASQTVNGCESDRSSISVTIYPIPSLPQVTTPLIYCLGDPASMLTAQGQNLLWYTSATGGIGSPTVPVPSTTAIGSTNYYVTQSANGCESGRAMITVTINDKVFASVDLSTAVVCQYDTIVVTSTSTNISSAVYTWNFSGGTVISGSGGGPYQVKWSSAGIKNITLNVANGNCSADDSSQITVNPSPDASFVLEADACLNEQINVQAAWGNLDNSAYTWSFDGATVISGSGPGTYRIVWDETGTKIVTLITVENGCLSEPFHDSITIHSFPIVKIEAEKTNNLCAGDLIQIKSTGNDPNQHYTYVWSPKEYFTYVGAQNAEATVKTTGYIYLKVTDDYGCDASDSIFIETKPCCDVYLPDAFTPNGDAVNDIFRLITIGHHKLSVFHVVNRWGQTVYEGGDSKSGWDGRFGGVMQPVGTYFYYLKYQCGTGDMIEKKGELTLIR